MLSMVLHTIDLPIGESFFLGQLSMTLHFLVPTERIAIDIRTGYPFLMQVDRITIDQFIATHWENYNKTHSLETSQRVLTKVDEWLEQLQKDLPQLLGQLKELELESISLEIFANYPYEINKLKLN